MNTRLNVLLWYLIYGGIIKHNRQISLFEVLSNESKHYCYYLNYPIFKIHYIFGQLSFLLRY